MTAKDRRQDFVTLANVALRAVAYYNSHHVTGRVLTTEISKDLAQAIRVIRPVMLEKDRASIG